MKRFIAVLVSTFIFGNSLFLSSARAESYGSPPGFSWNQYEYVAEPNEVNLSRSLLKLGTFGAILAGGGYFLWQRSKYLKQEAGKAYDYAFANYWVTDDQDPRWTGFQTRVNNTYARRLKYARHLEDRADSYSIGKLVLVTGAGLVAASALSLITLKLNISPKEVSISKEIKF